MSTNEGMDDFTRAYLACGLELAEEGLEQISTYDLPQTTVAIAQAHCDDFRGKAGLASKGDYVDGEVAGYSEDQAAYDFWLTRNGHGIGFWDRGLGEAGDVLTKLAEGFGPIDFYLGDDGEAYLA